MKPLGTITMCFPHVDEKTRSVLQSVMEEADNFGDFTERLCNRVISESPSKLLEYFVVYFPFHIGNCKMMEKLEKAGRVSTLTKPMLLSNQLQKGMNVSWDEFKTSIMNALNDAPNDWIASQLYLYWRLVADAVYTETDADVKPIEVVTSSISKNKELEYFKTFILDLEASRFLREGNIREALVRLRQALDIAQKKDDQVMVAVLLCDLASIIKHSDIKQAIDLFIKARELSENLGFEAQIGYIQHQLGHIMTLRGEYDAAIEYQHEYMSILESLGITTDFLKAIIAYQYNQIGNGERALELAKTVLDRSDPTHRQGSFPRAQFAWALINLGRYDEAKSENAIALKMATKSGDLDYLEFCKIVEGILDKAEGNFDAAIFNFKEVMKHEVDYPFPLTTNICLLNLTEIEIDLLTDESLAKKSNLSGPWMQKLVEHTEKKDLPGIAARAMLLKAKLRQRQGQDDEVRKILQEVQKIAEAPSMRYLKDLAISMFPEIIVT